MPGDDVIHPITDQYGRIQNFDFCSEVEPPETWAYMTWINPTTQVLKVRNQANTAWVLIGGGGGGPHHATHEDGGDDEISVAGLSGVLADKQDADHLQSRDVASDAPTDGDVLTWDATGSKWEPASGIRWPYAHVITVDKTDPDADYTNVDDALAAASGGDVIELGPSTSVYQVHNDITVGVTIRAYTQPGHEGSSSNPVHLEFHGSGGTTNIDRQCRFQDLEILGRAVVRLGFVTFDSCVIHAYSGGNFLTVTTYAPGDGRIIFRNCEFINQGGIANLANTIGSIELYDCRCRLIGAATLNHGANELIVGNFNWDSNLAISGAGTRINIGKPIVQAGLDASKGTPTFDGQLYYATDTDTLYTGDGGSWVAIGGPHHAAHENGGDDEISLAGLSGVLADKQDADHLQSRDVASDAPTDGDVLTWDATGSKWEPAASRGLIYVDRGDIASYDYSQATLTCDGAIHDLDLSPIITDSGAVLVKIKIYCMDAGTTTLNFSVLEDGNANVINSITTYTKDSDYDSADGDIVISSSRIVSYRCSLGMDACGLVVRGWWKPG